MDGDDWISLADACISALTLALGVTALRVGFREWKRQHAAKAVDSLGLDALRSLAELEDAIQRCRNVDRREQIVLIERGPPHWVSEQMYNQHLEAFAIVSTAASRVGPTSSLCRAVVPSLEYALVQRVLDRVEELGVAIEGYYYVQKEMYADRLEANEGYAQSAGKWRSIIMNENADLHGSVLRTEFQAAYAELGRLLIRPRQQDSK